MISQKAKYAFHALVALARTESLMVGEIAAQERIPRKFLEQILLELKRHGIVQSRRGKFGGYGLLMPADRITFGQVLRILDGPIAQDRLSALRRLPDRGELRDQARLRQGGGVGKRRSRPHHHSRCH